MTHLEQSQLIDEQFVTLGKQALEIQRLKSKVESLEDTVNRREEWLRKAKYEAGVDQMYSFDRIWKRCIDSFKQGLFNFENI